jgi:hypothetical protein
MSGSVRLALTLLAGVFAAFLIWRLLVFVVFKAIGILMGILIPLAIAAAVIYAVIYVVNRKALGSGGRRILP